MLKIVTVQEIILTAIMKSSKMNFVFVKPQSHGCKKTPQYVLYFNIFYVLSPLLFVLDDSPGQRKESSHYV